MAKRRKFIYYSEDKVNEYTGQIDPSRWQRALQALGRRQSTGCSYSAPRDTWSGAAAQEPILCALQTMWIDLAATIASATSTSRRNTSTASSTSSTATSTRWPAALRLCRRNGLDNIVLAEQNKYACLSQSEGRSEGERQAARAGAGSGNSPHGSRRSRSRREAEGEVRGSELRRGLAGGLCRSLYGSWRWNRSERMKYEVLAEAQSNALRLPRMQSRAAGFYLARLSSSPCLVSPRPSERRPADPHPRCEVRPVAGPYPRSRTRQSECATHFSPMPAAPHRPGECG